jgi:hypothetical protein
MNSRLIKGWEKGKQGRGMKSSSKVEGECPSSGVAKQARGRLLATPLDLLISVLGFMLMIYMCVAEINKKIP